MVERFDEIMLENLGAASGVLMQEYRVNGKEIGRENASSSCSDVDFFRSSDGMYKHAKTN